jgi:hypothetical protein
LRVNDNLAIKDDLNRKNGANMATIYQLDFFRDNETSRIEAKVDACLVSQDKCRKKQFAEIGALKKRITELEDEMIFIKRAICKS